MAGGDLVFFRPSRHTGELVFGEAETAAEAARGSFAYIAIALPAPGLQLVVVEPRSAAINISLPAPSMQLVAGYDAAVSRPVVGETAAGWQVATPASKQQTSPWRAMQSMPAGIEVRGQSAARLQVATHADWQDCSPLRAGAEAHHREAQRLATHPIRADHANAIRLRSGAQTRFQGGAHVRNGAAVLWQEADHAQRSSINTRWQDAQPLHKAQAAPFGVARPLPMGWQARWQEAVVPPPGKWVRPTTPVTPDRTPSANLLFVKPAGGADLVFGWQPSGATHIIPIWRSHIVFNDVSLRRTDSNARVGCVTLDISGMDADSWVPSWSAEIAYDQWPALAALNGEPLELEAIVNGHRWMLLAEGAPARSRVFGKTTVRIGGRGVSAWLDDPYAEVSSHYNTTQMTAQQLMAQALTTNGVSIGWDLDWQITDWTVPAGLWSYQGTPIGGVLDVASAVNAIVQADPASKILHVLPRYPAKPWEWADTTPDIEIPMECMESDGLEPVVKPAYNAVWVSGQTQGVLRRVFRAGSAADKLAPMITHPLISHDDAARQRGTAILGDTGRQARVSISLPISPDTGLLKTNMLASLPEAGDPWHGLVRSVSVSARREQSLKVRQTIELERHYAP